VAADYEKMTENLSRFYGFAGKTVLYVGAGRKQLLDPALPTKRVVAIDQDVEALKELQEHVAAQGLQATVQVVGSRFEDIEQRGDVVYFEFCLHEMADPHQALVHARTLAPDIVVYDHSPGSEWIYYGAEEDKVRSSSEIMERFGIRRRERLHTEQRFATYAELLAKVSPQGAVAVQRAGCHTGAANIVIPMDYELVLL
jgi:Methyltransferase domain